MILETINSRFISVTLQDIQQMSRNQLIKYLELRGCACYEDESTSLLRETAIEDWENEIE